MQVGALEWACMGAKHMAMHITSIAQSWPHGCMLPSTLLASTHSITFQ